MNIKTPLVTSMIQSSVAAPGSHALILASRGRKARQSVSLWLLLKGVEHMPLETPQIREERAAEQLSVYSSSLFSLSNMPSPTYMSQKYFQLTLCHGIPESHKHIYPLTGGRQPKVSSFPASPSRSSGFVQEGDSSSRFGPSYAMSALNCKVKRHNTFYIKMAQERKKTEKGN